MRQYTQWHKPLLRASSLCIEWHKRDTARKLLRIYLLRMRPMMQLSELSTAIVMELWLKAWTERARRDAKLSPSIWELAVDLSQLLLSHQTPKLQHHSNSSHLLSPLNLIPSIFPCPLRNSTRAHSNLRTHLATFPANLMLALKFLDVTRVHTPMMLTLTVRYLNILCTAKYARRLVKKSIWT